LNNVADVFVRLPPTGGGGQIRHKYDTNTTERFTLFPRLGTLLYIWERTYSPLGSSARTKIRHPVRGAAYP